MSDDIVQQSHGNTMKVSPLRLFHMCTTTVLRSNYRHSILPVLGSWAWLVAFPWPLHHTYNRIPASPRLDRIDSRILCDKDCAWLYRWKKDGSPLEATLHWYKLHGTQKNLAKMDFVNKLVFPSLVLRFSVFKPDGAVILPLSDA